MPESRPPIRGRRVLVVMLGLFVPFTYLTSSSRHLLGGDSAEFALIYAQGGIAHPSGYPLYTLWLRLLSALLPVDSPAWGASLATALLGSAAVLAFYAAARAWNASRSGAATGAALLAFTPLMWALSTQPEVFALHALLACLILWAAGPSVPVAPLHRAAWIGLFGGLGLSNNHSLVLLAPIGVFAAWEAVTASAHRLRAIGVGVAGFLVGLAPHLLLVASSDNAPGGPWQWGDPSTFSGLVHHVLRRDFGTFSLGHYDGEGLVLAQQAFLGESLARNLVWLGLPLALAGHLLLAKQARRVGRREVVRWSMLVASLLLAGPFFVSRFRLAPEGLGQSVIERFHLLPLILVAFGLPFAVDAGRRRLGLAREMAVIPVVVAIAFGVMFSLGAVRDAHRPTLELYARNVLNSLPEDAVLVGTGDHRLFIFLWMDRVAKERADVTYIDGSLLLYPWYAERIEAQLGFPLEGLDHANASVATVRMLRSIEAQGRPVFLTHRYTGSIVREMGTVPHGAVYRVLRADEPGPDMRSVALSNQRILTLYNIETDPPSERDRWGTLIHADYARPWLELASAFESVGANEPAATFRENAEQLLPSLRRP